MYGVKATTKSGTYVIVDITEFLPGQMIPKEYIKESENGTKNFFFQPADWSEENGWGNITIAERRNYPIIYSPGYATVGEALTAAEKWERKSGRQIRKNEKILDEWKRTFAGEWGDA